MDGDKLAGLAELIEDLFRDEGVEDDLFFADIVEWLDGFIDDDNQYGPDDIQYLKAQYEMERIL